MKNFIEFSFNKLFRMKGSLRLCFFIKIIFFWLVKGETFSAHFKLKRLKKAEMFSRHFEVGKFIITV